MASKFFIQNKSVHTQQYCDKIEQDGFVWCTDTLFTAILFGDDWCGSCLKWDEICAAEPVAVVYRSQKGNKIHVSKFCPTLKSRKRKFQRRKFYTVPLSGTLKKDACNVCMPSKCIYD